MACRHQENEVCCKRAQKAGVLGTNADFEYCKIDQYYQGSIVEKLCEKKARVFHAFLEDMEPVQFGSKGDYVCTANVLTKYGGLSI